MLNTPHHDDSSRKRLGPAIYTSETSGLLVIAFLLLVLTAIRYWHAFHWSMR